MKTLLIAVLTFLGMSFIAPDAEARSRDRHRHRHGNYYTSHSYRHYPRYYYGHRHRHYYRPVRYYHYDSYYPRYYYREPGVTLRFRF